MNLKDKVIRAFLAQFGTQPALLVRAPGRVNLIGEHTDYNDGFVLPMAIDRAAWIALRPRADRQVAITSLDMGETAVFDLDNLQRNQATWVEYLKGVAWALQENDYLLTGWEGVITGDVPIGAGLSSSAAVEMAAARAFTAVATDVAVTRIPWQPADMARIGQLAENQWMGVNSGIMDQMISAAGEEGHALLIDCRTLETEAAPLPPGTAVVILDTNTRRGLVDSAYNERRQQCETAAAYFGVPALRDVSWEAFQADSDGLDEVVRRRTQHVLTENGRVLQAKAAMLQGDAVTLGQLLNASHRSLRDDFEVSSSALDTIVEEAQNHPACYGARMTGAGFGGCAVALVQDNANALAEFIQTVGDQYQTKTGLTPPIFICHAAAGASVHWYPPGLDLALQVNQRLVSNLTPS